MHSLPSCLGPEVAPHLRDRLTCVEYFAGIGLVRLGLERAGWRANFANDWSGDKAATYTQYFRDSSSHYHIADVFDLRAADIPEALLATASFPCIDLSLAGKSGGMHGKHSRAFWGFTNLLRDQPRPPRLLLLENVNGWLTSNRGQDFRLTISALNDLGYVCDVISVDAAHFLPQSRPRIFVIGATCLPPNYDLLTLARRAPSLCPTALSHVIAANSDLDWHFLPIPPLPEKGHYSLKVAIEQLESEDPRWWNQVEVKRHLDMMTDTTRDYLLELRQQSTPVYRTMYRRIRNGMQRAEVRKDEIAGCLRTATGGSSRQMLVRAGNGAIDMRVMTPREYARLQGVPDDYPLPARVNQALTGFGDAVCVPAITWIAENILTPLALTFDFD